jgi:hypothetical protein
MKLFKIINKSGREKEIRMKIEKIKKNKVRRTAGG